MDSGATAMIFGILTPVLFLAVGAAVDFSMYQRERTRLQGQVDAAAIASAREMQLARTETQKVAAVAQNFVHTSEPDAAVTTRVNLKDQSVTVTAQKQFDPAMTQILWQRSTVSATATARLNGMLPLCLLALERGGAGTVHLEQSASMTAKGCMVYSNSKSASGLQAEDNATIEAGLVCTAGGKVKSGGATISPDPVTDCPRLDDPLSSRTPPSVGACRFNEVTISGGSHVLEPGVYCQGLTLTDNAIVTLKAGIYIIKDGPLLVNKGATVNGTDVGIYLTGRRSNLVFEANSTINLSAPKDGPLAGILIFDDPSGAKAPAIPPYPLPVPLVGELLGALQPAGPPREHKILSDNARLLLGTIYMPQGRLIIDASKPIADKSAYTVLVVRRIDLHAGPNLVLNSDYSATDVPVPKGVGPYGNNIMLTN
jgi:hypothetical protein